MTTAGRRDGAASLPLQPVALLPCPDYGPERLQGAVARLMAALDFRVAPGSRVLLKPNLVASGRRDGLACTNPDFVAAVASWFLAQGARVAVGDSPAFGSARGVMAKCGMTAALAGLPVELVNFDRVRPVRLAHGFTVGMVSAALECDLLVNLPRIKAHGQTLVSLAVKNYFGTVKGFRKALIHNRYGQEPEIFARLLVDLLAVLPPGISLADGVVAMHRNGPTSGEPFPLGLVAAARNPVALDNALLAVLGIDPARSLLWRECARRGLPGTDLAERAFPLSAPATVARPDFKVPTEAAPLTFNLWRLCRGGLKRLSHRLLP